MNNKKPNFLLYALLGSFILVGYLLYKMNSLENASASSASASVPEGIHLWAIFLTGLITGGLTCLAVQGGLLAATIAQRQEESMKEGLKNSGNAFPIFIFLIFKLIAYTVLGFLLGLFGSVFELSLTARIIMQLAVALFMIGTALNILNVHPIFRYFVIQPPRFLTRLVRKQAKSKSIFAPASLGAFTVFIPCGTTQAMMALSIGSANPFLGAAVLFAFILGTSPLFFILGYFATKLGDSLHQKFMKFAAIVLILLAIFNLKGTLALAGFGNFPRNTNDSNLNGKAQKAVEEATIEFNQTSYSPSAITVKAGSNVTLKLVNRTGQGCIQAFTIPKLGIQKIVRVGTSEEVNFLAPTKPGTIPFMCSMGMYQGIINVI